MQEKALAQQEFEHKLKMMEEELQTKAQPIVVQVPSDDAQLLKQVARLMKENEKKTDELCK